MTPIAHKSAVRLVLDTNTAISGLLWHGTPGKLIDAARAKSVTLCTSAMLLAEPRGVLTREKFASQLNTRGLNAIEVFDGYAALTAIVFPATIQPTIVNDPSDDAVLACALGAKAELIVSGDRHLLDLLEYQSIRIVTATEAVTLLAAK